VFSRRARPFSVLNGDSAFMPLTEHKNGVGATSFGAFPNSNRLREVWSGCSDIQSDGAATRQA